VAAASLSAYLLWWPRFDVRSGWLFFSMLFLACGSGCLNNYQDRFWDKDFSRTKDRPLPAKRISPSSALALTTVLMTAGLYGLARQSLALFLLGLLAAACYNALYTPLKRRTMWALAPGVVCGMLPPWMGWLAAGGEPFSQKIWLIMIIFGVWQMPHFWLLLLSHHADYVKTGAPSMLRYMVNAQLERILLVWVIGLAALTLCLPLAHLIRTEIAFVALAINATGLIVVFCILLFPGRLRYTYRGLFVHLNMAVFISMLILVADRTFSFYG